MATDEKYLDNLLKSLTEGEEQMPETDDVQTEAEEAKEAEDAVLDINELNSLLNDAFPLEEDADTMTDGESEEEPNEFADLFAETFAEPAQENPSEEKEDDWKVNLDDLLAQAESEDMSNSDENSSFLSESASAAFAESLDPQEESPEDKEKKPKGKLFFWKKAEKPKKEKKQKDKENDSQEKESLFTKIITYLTQEEELANVGEENAQILKELNEEDQKKKKKKKKKSKAASEQEEGEEGEETPKKKKKKEKKKKEKPPKEPKEPKEKIKEKPIKVLSKRNLIVLIAACATLISGICALGIFLPEFADKQNARQAYYIGDYEEAYRLLYDKNKNDSDLTIYNKVKTVLTIQRRLDAYENYRMMNKELEALDALMRGVTCYQELGEADQFGVRSEVDEIYRQICSILEENYGITAEEALEINGYDDVSYTRTLEAIRNGTEFRGVEEEPEEELPPQDILPEEDGLISY